MSERKRTRTPWSFIPEKHSMLELYAKQGLSINQAARALGLTATHGLRDYLKQHPDLYSTFLANGLNRSNFGTVNQKRRKDVQTI